MAKGYFDRLPHIENFEKLVCEDICESYQLGIFKGYNLVETGYEDFNFVLKTSKGEYFVKIFNKERKEEECRRIIRLISLLIKNNVHHPKLYKNKKEELIHEINLDSKKVILCLMEFIEGKTFFELDELPNGEEIKKIAGDLSHLHSIKFEEEIPHVYDSWSIINLGREYQKKKEYLNNEEIKLLEPIIKEFNEMDFESLPKALVHGDLLKTNVIRGNDGQPWMIDFSVANIYPRMLETAIISTHLLFDVNSKENTRRNIEIFLKEYEKTINLTNEEKKAFSKLIMFSYAIEYINTLFERRVKNNKTKENSLLFLEAQKGLEWGELKIPTS